MIQHPRDLLLNFDILVKNRLGPYGIIFQLKDGKYFGPSENVAYNYLDSIDPFTGEFILDEARQLGAKIFLVSGKYETELFEGDFRKENW